MKFFTVSVIFLFAVLLKASAQKPRLDLDLQKTRVWGPGLKTDFFLPVRYFFIQAVSSDGEK